MTSYQLATRSQFSFTVNDKQLACLLTLNNSFQNAVSVNIVAIFIQRADNKHDNYVKIVVGNSDPNTNISPTNQQQLIQFRENLCKLGIDYIENQIIQIFNICISTNTPGVLHIILVNLLCNDIPIISNYAGESIIIDVSSKLLNKAVNIISNIDVINPDAKLCINRFNVDQKCLCN